MKNPFQIGDRKTFRKIVEEPDTATFNSGTVHPVYATFALGRDAEWCCRLFVLEMKEEDEEGIGTFLNIQHFSPALVGEEIEFTATVVKLEGHEIVCHWEAFVNQRKIATGEQGQKILQKERLERLFANISPAID